MDDNLQGLGYWKLFFISFIVFVVRVFDRSPKTHEVKRRSIH